MARTHRTEHPDVNIDDVVDPILAAGWRDESWHNDECPRFVSPDSRLTLWVGAEPRFIVQPNDAEGQPDHDVDPLLMTDDVGRLQAFLHADAAAVDEAVEAATDAACVVLLKHLGVDHGDHAAMYWHGSKPRAALADLLRDYLDAERRDRDANLG